MVDDSSTAPLRITSELAPDLGLVERFIREMFAQGALALLLATVMALLTRMRDLNTELMRQVALGRRKRPPSETMHRLQLELPLWSAVPTNDAQPPKRKTPKKRGPRKPRPHGRAKLPEHLERRVHNHWVEPSQCTCPYCAVDTAHVKFVPSERLDIEPARFVVRVDRREMRACQQCHDYVVTAPRPDAIVERGVLGDDLVVHATVDHYEDGVPWERMQRRAREQGVPLSANTLAAASGRAIDLLDPILRHILARRSAPSTSASMRPASACSTPTTRWASARARCGSCRATTATRTSCTLRAAMLITSKPCSRATSSQA